jgi:broad specificity phosphatase PhoE
VRRLVLVRHAAVELVDGIPADRWLLSADGRRAAVELARRPHWTDLSVLASSPEPKALATAAPIASAAGCEVHVEPDLREAERPRQRVFPRDEFLALTRRYLAGEPVPGWEPAAEVRRRVADCIERLLAGTDGDVGVVSHGLALSLYLGSSFEEWRRIELPAVAVVDPDTGTMLQPWAGVEATRSA